MKSIHNILLRSHWGRYKAKHASGATQRRAAKKVIRRIDLTHEKNAN